MVTLLILLILFIGVYSGYKNGFIIELLKSIGYVFTLMFAFDYCRWLSELLYLFVPYPTPFAPTENPYHYYDMSLMFSLDNSYYYLVSFLIIMAVGWLITRIVVQFVSYYLKILKAPEPFNGIAGGILGFLVNYVGVFLVLFALTTIPFGLIQNQLSGSFAADKILTSTPVLTDNAYQRFILDVNEEELANRPLMDVELPTEENADEAENNE